MSVSTTNPWMVNPAAISSTVADAVASLPAISLAELNDAAALQVRVDRKYILTVPQLETLVGEQLHRLASLEIDGARSFAYESVYFDSPELRSYHDAAHRRRKRFKVRTRTYLDDQTTMLEIKTRDGRGSTIKERHGHSFDHRDEIDCRAGSFVDASIGVPGFAARLLPVLTTGYRRTTLVDLDDIARVTIDDGLRCVDWSGGSFTLDDRVIVETKSTRSPSMTDRLLWAAGIRPSKISKFGTGLAALHPELPSNKWHQTLRRHFTTP